MEWTPEALKAEIDYRQAALRAAAAHSRVDRKTTAPRQAWWRRLGHPSGPESDHPRHGHREAV